MDLGKYRRLQLAPWQRKLLIAVLVVLTSQLHFSPQWAETFRVSASVILFPCLLVTLMRDSHRPDTGWVTGLCVLIFRAFFSLLDGMPLLHALAVQFPGAAFYICYDVLLCLLIRDRRTASYMELAASFFLCDICSNTLELLLSSRFAIVRPTVTLLSLAGLALTRAALAAILLWAVSSYRRLLLRTEHELRYRRLFLMTANLKTELYFLKKDAEDIEGVMSNAYRLYEKLEKDGASEELASLALSIARDVHEVKKDNLRIIRGLEENVAEAYDHQSMSLSDLFSILEDSTRQMLGEQRAAIRLECRYDRDFPVKEHYRLLSILKNLVTNSIEAIQSTGRRGTVRVEVSAPEDAVCVTVSDDGPGIPARAMKMLFNVGYSTKFNADTGDISRGVGLPAVRYIAEELGGSVTARSEPGQGAAFRVELPFQAIAGGERA